MRVSSILKMYACVVALSLILLLEIIRTFYLKEGGHETNNIQSLCSRDRGCRQLVPRPFPLPVVAKHFGCHSKLLGLKHLSRMWRQLQTV